MPAPQSDWNEHDWLARCAWCAGLITEDRQVLILEVGLPAEHLRQYPPASIHPIHLTKAAKTVPIIIPSVDSVTRRDGAEALFQVCCKKCGKALETALRQELPVTKSRLVHPDQIVATEKPSPIEGLDPEDYNFARRSMEQMMKHIQRMIEEKNISSVEDLDEFLKELENMDLSELEPLPPASPLELAQEMVADAWELPTRKRRINMAKRALEVDPDCADAYLLLAQEQGTSLTKAAALYEKAVHAAERNLGSDAFENYAGHFWGMLETRPYMRARASLAECLWELGDHDAAIEHYQALLELNPNDNQGLRYILADFLLAEGRDADLEKLLDRYPDDGASAWDYDRALWLFRKEGPGRKANQALAKALKANQFVPSFLLGEKPIPEALPAAIGCGDENEAVDYAYRGTENWRNTPYALDWLREKASA